MELGRLGRSGIQLLLAAIVAAGAPQIGITRDLAAEGSFDRTLKVTGPVELEVTTGSGSITVHTGGSDTVRVIGTIRAHTDSGIDRKEAEEKVRYLETRPPIEQNGNALRIGRIEDEELRRNVSISYELTVPAETRMHSATGSGSQTIDGIRGPLDASTGSGRLKLSHIGAEVRASTGSGSIELDTIQGSVRASTGSGHIRGAGVAGAFIGHTGSGGVDVEQTAPGNTEVETGSGTITLRGVRGSLRVRTGSGGITAEGTPAGEWLLHTGSGGVRVRLPRDAAFDLRAHTSSGHIHTGHPITVEGTLSRREVRGKVRGGGYLVDVSTSSGNVEIE